MQPAEPPSPTPEQQFAATINAGGDIVAAFNLYVAEVTVGYAGEGD